ncbi:outer membrane lipoprotein-sorting protein [Agarivorans sp. DSG3-1]|uniref:outer membrane lipoprotein-sorting protein n=1 Tax=Agarivorans sp. DSG3-1 TaxID=3342249 RepID=UPI00398EE508
MFSLFKLWLLGSLFSIGFAQANDEVTLRLLEADSYRLQSSSAKIVTQVSQFEKQTLKKKHYYNVYIRPERESLVVFKAQSELGQKMLMLGDNYWLLMPNSRRPIRITPMQKLLGEASVGDVSTLTWSEDYQGELGETKQIEGVKAIHLKLEAKTSGASYQKIDLWLAQESNFPLQADLYLKSGKLAKQAYFEQGQRQGRAVVKTMTLVDSIQTNKSTVINYQSVEPHSLADKYYNPAYLSKQSLEQL